MNAVLQLVYPILLEDNLKVFMLVCGVVPVAFYLKDGYVNSTDVSLVQVTSTTMIFVPLILLACYAPTSTQSAGQLNSSIKENIVLLTPDYRLIILPELSYKCKASGPDKSVLYAACFATLLTISINL